MEQLYRGKTYSGKWAYGYHYQHEHNSFIGCVVNYRPNINYGVRPESIGQYINLTDKNEAKMFVGQRFAFTKHKGCTLESFEAVINFDTNTAAFGYIVDGTDYFRPFNSWDELREDLLNHVTVLED